MELNLDELFTILQFVIHIKLENIKSKVMNNI